jgi:VIT1/CCC1 family predicted Fe2+/Mn2+ transporter
MIRQSLAVAVAFGLLLQDAAFAQQAPTLQSKQVQISWEELSGLVIDRKISTTLPDGTRLEGEALAVRPEALVLDVHKTSNKKLYLKGQTAVPRQAVSEVRVIRVGGPFMRIFLGILGGIGGAFGATALGFVTDSVAALVPAILVGIPLAAVAGYYAGKLADTHTTRLLIQDAAQPGDSEEIEGVDYAIR